MVRVRLILPLVVVSLAMLACLVTQVPNIAPTLNPDGNRIQAIASTTFQPTRTATKHTTPEEPTSTYSDARPLDTLYATEPGDFHLASGQIQLVELFAFW
jgi:hypothetical protein